MCKDISIDEDLYGKKYHVPSSRLRNFDYRSEGWYCITMCTKGRVSWFGTVHNGIMGLSDVGCTVAHMWQRIPMIRSNIQLDEWIIMPDHMHGIIVINDIDRGVVETDQWSVSTDVASLMALPRRTPNSLGSIIAQFKPACTKKIRSMGYPDFGWQPRFYDRILWDVDQIDTVRTYIRTNPMRWKNNEKS